MEENLHCYTFEQHKFSKGLLDASVDATYVIHLRGNGRYESILKEVTDYTPTSLVYILLNNGYKKCKKVLPQANTEDKKNSQHDLVDAQRQIYKHANTMQYKNILILEDDCFFSPTIRDTKVLNNLNTFLIDNSSSSFAYRLGCTPLLLNPFLTHPSGYSLALHAYIMTAKARYDVLNTDPATIFEGDVCMNSLTTQYTYYKPLAYQLFPETENQNVWFHNWPFHEYYSEHCKKMTVFMIKLLNLDVAPEPGFSITYTIAKILYSLLILLALFLVYKGVQWIPFLLKAMQPLRKFKGRTSK